MSGASVPDAAPAVVATEEVLRKVSGVLKVDVIESREAGGMAVAVVPVERWQECCLALRDSLGFDYLASLTAVDSGDVFEVTAHLSALGAGLRLALKCRTARETASVPTVSDVWPGANWHERETHELFGIDFPGHPDLRNLLLPDEWEGYPLRKDYVEPD